MTKRKHISQKQRKLKNKGFLAENNWKNKWETLLKSAKKETRRHQKVRK